MVEPGCRRVQTELRGQITAAHRVERTEPDPAPIPRAEITPELTAIVMDGGIYDQHGRLLAELPAEAGRRPAVHWRDLGASQPVLVHGLHSQGPPNWKRSIWAYRSDRGRFEPVRWRFPDGSVRTQVVGFTSFQDPGEPGERPTVLYLDEERYPELRNTFQWSDGELRVTNFQQTYPGDE